MRRFYEEHYQALQLLLDNNLLNTKDVSFSESIHKEQLWTEKQIRAVHKLLKNYSNQLSDHNIYYCDLIDNLKNEKTKNTTPDILFAELKHKTIYLSIKTENKEKFSEILSSVRQLQGRKWNPHMKKWSIPVSRTGIDAIIGMGFKLDSALSEYYSDLINPEIQAEEQRKYSVQVFKKKLNMENLFPFQVEGIAFTEKLKGRVLIADQMGCGKTIQALGYLHLHPEIRPVIIICPATIKINWQREIKKWLNEDSYIIYGKNNIKEYQKEKIIIINYDIVDSHWESLKKLNPQIIIMDEAHKIKSSKTIRTKVVKKLCKNIPHVIALTGTPIMNKPIEIFNVAQILKPEIFDSYYRFGQKYCDPQNNGFGITYKGASNVEELHKLLSEHIMIRRKQEDVLKDLPDKRKDLILFDLEPSIKQKYIQANNDIISFISEKKGIEAGRKALEAAALVKFNELKQLTIEGKMKACITWIEDFLESEEKLVIFTVHRKTINLLMERFPNISVKIDGSCNQNQRQEAVDQFQNNPDIKLFIGNIQAASEGITLTAAHNLAFIELGWTAALHAQAEFRIMRIGQENACMIYYLLAKDTIEEDIAEIIDQKQQLSDAILDGEITHSENLLSHLIKKYEREKIHAI